MGVDMEANFDTKSAKEAYAEKETDDLINIAFLDNEEFLPEAISIARDELSNRGIASSEHELVLKARDELKKQTEEDEILANKKLNSTKKIKTYKIFSSPLGSNEAVKQGWSWPGFFFIIFWAFVKKMWVLGSSVLVLLIVLVMIEEGIEASSGVEAPAWQIAIINGTFWVVSVIFGVSGNQWREKNLLSRGFEYKDTVYAENPEAGLALWVKKSGSISIPQHKDETEVSKVRLQLPTSLKITVGFVIAYGVLIFLGSVLVRPTNFSIGYGVGTLAGWAIIAWALLRVKKYSWGVSVFFISVSILGRVFEYREAMQTVTDPERLEDIFLGSTLLIALLVVALVAIVMPRSRKPFKH